MHDNLYGPLEERLADEARRMLEDSPCSPATNLRADLRRRRRIIVAALSSATAIVVMALVATSLKRPPAGGAGRAPTVAGDSRNPAAASSKSSAPRDVNGSNVTAGRFESGPPSFLAIAILLPAAGDQAEPEFVPGWYVPEQVEVLGASDLSPAEHSAVSRLLGLEPEVTDDETI